MFDDEAVIVAEQPPLKLETKTSCDASTTYVRKPEKTLHDKPQTNLRW